MVIEFTVTLAEEKLLVKMLSEGTATVMTAELVQVPELVARTVI